MVHTGDTGIRVERKFQGLDLVRWFLERERERRGREGKRESGRGGGVEAESINVALGG